MIRALDAGDGVTVAVHDVVGTTARPVLAVLAGVHGDEFEGQVALRMVLASLDPARLHGTVRAAPSANPPAVAAATRCSPYDGANLARVFPGSPGGTVTSRIARLLTDHVIADADLLVDLHSAGTDLAMPLFAGYPRASGDAAATAARTFGAPLIWEHDTVNAGRSLSAALELGVPCLYVEGSGGGGLRGHEVDVYVAGVWRLLHLLGMYDVPDLSPPPAARLLTGGDGDVDASVTSQVDGWCVSRARAGAHVEPGDPIADVVGDDGRIRQRLIAPMPATLMCVRRRALTRTGDLLAMFGPVAR